MSRLLVGGVERIMFCMKRYRQNRSGEVLMLFVSAFLATAGGEFLQNNAYGDAFSAIFAVRSIGKLAAASKALLDKAAINIGIN